jgi:aspartate carbamoyltransferase catalytic subunit
LKQRLASAEFTRDELLQLLAASGEFRAGLANGRDFTGYCRGKVLASLFFSESTRTLAAIQSAIVRLGGGNIGFAGASATHVATSSEKIIEVISAFEAMSDVIALRQNQISLDELRWSRRRPIINCGTCDHVTA